MVPTASIVPLLRSFVRWAAQQPQIIAVALVGSYAREAARADSDVDLVVLTTAPESFRQQTEWLEELDWQIARWNDEDYGLLWSRRLELDTGIEVEIGFTLPQWASTDPIDADSWQIVNDGCWILFDPGGLLHHLMQATNLNLP